MDPYEQDDDGAMAIVAHWRRPGALAIQLARLVRDAAVAGAEAGHAMTEDGT
jgi:hypothetical protein